MNENDKLLAEYESVVQAVVADPDLMRSVQEKLGVAPESEKEPKNQSKDGGSDAKPQIDATGVAMQDLIIKMFQEKERKQLGGKSIKDMPTDRRKRIETIIGQHIVKYLPQGQVNLKVLPDLLEDGFEKALKLIGETAHEGEVENPLGKQGEMPSSGEKKGSTPLTAKEKEAAQKLGISEKDYADQKQAITSGDK